MKFADLLLKNADGSRTQEVYDVIYVLRAYLSQIHTLVLLCQEPDLRFLL